MKLTYRVQKMAFKTTHVELEQINKIYEKYINDPSYVFKMSSPHMTHKWIIMLKKLDDTNTDELRDNVVDENYAVFRADKLQVVCIFDALDPQTTRKSIINSYYDVHVDYIVGEIVECDSFDKNINKTKTNGIHYLKSIEGAFYFGPHMTKYNGPWKTFDKTTGKLIAEGNIINGQRTGQWKCYNMDTHIIDNLNFYLAWFDINPKDVNYKSTYTVTY